MASEVLFRFSLIGIVVVMFLISMVYRARAGHSGGSIKRSNEGLMLIVVRFVFASLLYLPILAYMIRPSHMAWSSVSLPDWIRVAGLISFSLITANSFIAAMSIVAVAAVLVVIIPREETQLVDRFGDIYVLYRSRSGRLLPRFRAPDRKPS